MAGAAIVLVGTEGSDAPEVTQPRPAQAMPVEPGGSGGEAAGGTDHASATGERPAAVSAAAEPATAKPAVAEPAAKPAVAEPAATEPTVAEPAATEPAAAEPAAAKPAATAPDHDAGARRLRGERRAPPNTNRRIALTPFVAAPVLAMVCAIEGQTAARPDLHVGHRSVVGCTVSNTGDAAGGVELEVAIAGGTPTRSAPRPIAAGDRATFDQEITIPRGLPMDATVEIAIVARDRQSSRNVRHTIVGVIRKPRLCVPGQLTRAQYDAKMAELRASSAAGDLTQTQLDRYDAELIACLRRSPRGKATSRPARPTDAD
jgi:hypothetical protein